VALRFGEQTYHFQYHEGGVLRLQRDDSAGFLHAYAGLENRDVHVRRIAVSHDTYALLRTRFNDRFLLEARQFAALDAVRSERDVREALARGVAPEVVLRGAGFFAPPGPHAGEAGASAGPPLARAAIERRRAEVERALADLAGMAVVEMTIDAAPHAYAAAAHTYAERARELLEAASALDVLARDAPLAVGALRWSDAEELRLAPEEVAALAAFAATLDARAAALLGSPRPDWGHALLLTLARRAAVDASLAAGRLLVLDAYPPDAATLSPGEVAARADVLPRLLADARDDLRAARAHAAAAAPRESTYGDVEAAANRFVELHESATRGAPLRLAPGALVPAGAARATLPAAALPDPASGRRAADAAREAEARWAAELRRRYAYDLLSRNCVSEIFREIEDALAGVAPDGDACAESARRLGGCVPPGALPGSIPFVAARDVGRALAVAETDVVPSHRSARLAAMYERENDLAVFLRESNVLTSRIYRPRAEDSPFLFFTDDAPALRPLLGAVNLATGLGAGAAGLLLLPTGDADLLVAGLRGALFSLPELAFVSLRKGSFDHVPRRPVGP